MLRSSRCTLSSGPAAFIQKRCRSPFLPGQPSWCSSPGKRKHDSSSPNGPAPELAGLSGKARAHQSGPELRDLARSGKAQNRGRLLASSWITYHCARVSSSSCCLCISRKSDGVAHAKSHASDPALFAQHASSASGICTRKMCSSPCGPGIKNHESSKRSSGRSRMPQSSRNAWKAIGPSRSSIFCSSCRAKLGGGFAATMMPAASNVLRMAASLSPRKTSSLLLASTRLFLAR
mmetsp:Transcript_61988/g.145378  ORF Transcript_61988/g.145378 Transcript_61988/m.145378 type:complete len:234 (+) Transcript_61988:238-939(+)